MNSPVTKISYLDGIRFKRTIIAGANWLIQMQDYLDNINVFPVPDHDTGTNMAYTMKGIVENIENHKESSVSEMSNLIAESSLINAQGNSGAILAQFFQGLSEELKGHRKVNTEVFGNAASIAAERARDAILDPREGTILTVIRDWGHHIKTTGGNKKDFADLFKDSFFQAQESLQKTTEQLESLKKAGVVDAGAQGFIYLLEGIVDFIENGRIDRKAETGFLEDLSRISIKEEPSGDTKFRYCTECLLAGENIDIKFLKKELKKLGDSIVVAGSNKKVRVHIHTNDPGNIINTISAYGHIQNDKVDDIHQQYRDAFEHRDGTIAVVTDTTCDLPEDIMQEYNIHLVPLHVSFGQQGYIDKFTISVEEFYKKLVTSKHHPKTSQPTPKDFKRTYDLLAKHYESIISIHISSRLSGTFQAAKQTAAALSDKISVIDSKTASIGLGLIVLKAARAVRKGLNKDDVIKHIHKSIEKSTLLLSPKTIEYLIRGGRLGKVRGFLGKLMRLKPIFTINKTGEIQVIKKILGRKEIHKETIKLLKKNAGKKSNLSFIIARGNSPETTQWYREEILKYFRPDELLVADISPVIGTHVGPDAAGITFIYE
jgi:DAK2 domain fusion protein YloV